MDEQVKATRFEKKRTRQESRKRAEVKKRLTLTVLSAAVGLITPCAYLVGFYFHRGYLSAFGVESDGFPAATPHIYILSYHTLGYFLLTLGNLSVGVVNQVFSPPRVYWAVGISITAIIGLYILLRIVRRGLHSDMKMLANILGKLATSLDAKNNDFIKAIGVVATALYVAIAVAIGIAAAAVFWWWIPQGAYVKGREVAQQRVIEFRSKGCQENKETKWDSCFILMDDKKTILHQGLLIAINDKEMAFLEKDGSYIFPRKDNTFLVRKLH